MTCSNKSVFSFLECASRFRREGNYYVTDDNVTVYGESITGCKILLMAGRHGNPKSVPLRIEDAEIRAYIIPHGIGDTNTDTDVSGRASFKLNSSVFVFPDGSESESSSELSSLESESSLDSEHLDNVTYAIYNFNPILAATTLALSFALGAMSYLVYKQTA